MNHFRWFFFRALFKILIEQDLKLNYGEFASSELLVEQKENVKLYKKEINNKKSKACNKKYKTVKN